VENATTLVKLEISATKENVLPNAQQKRQTSALVDVLISRQVKITVELVEKLVVQNALVSKVNVPVQQEKPLVERTV